MRKYRLAANLLLGALALAACGDDSSTPVDAPKPPDAAPPDAADVVMLSDREGGGIIFEYIKVSPGFANFVFGANSGVTTITRVMAHFMDNMSPQAEPTPVGGQCADLYATNGWPSGQGTQRSYFDVGDLAITDSAGVDKIIPKKFSGKDNIGKFHDVFYELLGPPAYQVAGGTYDVKMSGYPPIFPASTFDNVLYMPDDYSSTMTPPPNVDNLHLTPGTDFVSTWTPQANAGKPAETEVLNLTLLIDPNTGTPVILCVTLASAGTFTMPGAMITSFKNSVAARGGSIQGVAVLSRQQDSHILRRLPNGEPDNKRRIDFLGSWCHVQIVTID
jgi:hypothetical protein